ncbi:YezD family protein [Geomonas subterranea]|uniref:YezD family protein n=1 Tax=Geomonas subterranea TaxID=2847989 RepID=A0ABX8LHZ8_9BACT|nr:MULTISPECIES: YezD family protein [Geomonas]QXE91363.1 YezD family protein [Geomonas subterranea]QXM10550.1 YezD family protein [Geomonas subterranea]
MSAQSPDPWNPELEQIIRDLLVSLRFGTLTLVVQDGRVIQVDRSEKYRLNKPGHIDGSGI